MKTPRAKARGFMLMKMTILRFAPGAIHPQAEAWGLLAFSMRPYAISFSIVFLRCSKIEAKVH